MSESLEDQWRGIKKGPAGMLATRDYSGTFLSERLATSGMEAGEILSAGGKEIAAQWISGVEIFARTVHAQRFRGVFGELARRDEGLLGHLKLWPQQWATARMFAHTAKGFHVHPPFIPTGENAAEYLRQQFEGRSGSTRAYEREQWDVMFFVQGRVEMILRDLRAGMPGRTMRLFIDGDNHRGANNAGVVIPPGVAHALRVEGNEDAIMVYGTSTSFRPEFEGRLASEVETAALPAGWQELLDR